LRISLNNPVGLNIQTPNFGTYQQPFTAPVSAAPADYWKVIRGRVKQGEDEMDMILHAVYEVPADQGFTVGDITIGGFNIDFGSQITETFQIGLAGLGLPQVDQEAKPLTCASSSPQPLPRPYALTYLSTINEALRSSLNLRLEPGMNAKNIALYAFDCDKNASLSIPDGSGVNLELTGVRTIQGGMIYLMNIDVEDNVALGDRSLMLTNANGTHGPAVYGMMTIVAKGTLNSIAAVDFLEHEPLQVTSERPMGAQAR
jgi:hypothetical protein